MNCSTIAPRATMVAMDGIIPSRLFKAAKEVADFMEAQGWSYCLIGGLAVQRWGEPRATLDADFLLITGWGEDSNFIIPLLERFQPRISDAREFALENRVLLINATNGKTVDISLGALPYEYEVAQRAVPVEFHPGCTIPCCTPEDLFVMKVFAARPLDWRDAEAIVARQHAFDKKYVVEQLKALSTMKEDADWLSRAKHLLEGKP